MKKIYQFTIKEAEEKLKSFINEDDSECSEVKIVEFYEEPKGGAIQDNLKLFTTLKLGKTDGNGFISEAKDVFKSYIDPDFTNWELNEKQFPSGELDIDVFELTKDATFEEIFTDKQRMVMTQSQIIEFCKNYSEFLRKEITFFLMEVDNKYFVVRVRVFSGGLSAHVYRLECDGVWHGEPRHRVVSPQLRTL